MTLNEWIHHLYRVFGKRNRYFLPDPSMRLHFLHRAIGDMQDGERKRIDLELLGMATARVFANIVCVANHFRDVPINQYLCAKYGARACAYCSKFPCACPPNRPEPKYSETVSEVCLNWSLREWQFHLNMMYGEKNREKGVDNVVARLFKEVTEIESVISDIKFQWTRKPDLTIEDIEKDLACEFADAIAWTLAFANLVNLDLEAAVEKTYRDGCGNCHQNSCRCTRIDVRPINWSLAQPGKANTSVMLK